jgi:glyoxylase-like metal-dependent hydrolase (beta-lactamase superfamily II)
MALKIADHWFERKTIDDAITLLWEPYVDPLIRCNIWHVRGRDFDLMIDTGLGIASLAEAAQDLLEKPVKAVATHTHYDHVGGHHEFHECIVHKLEEASLRNEDKSNFAGLTKDTIDPYVAEKIEASGYKLKDVLVTAIPKKGFNLEDYELKGVQNKITTVEAGDVIDLGDRQFEILHLPGHSPGSIGLWEAESGTLFSGDAIYDGPLIETLPGADLDQYIATLRTLMDIPATVVHAGHDPSFGRDTLQQIARKYLTMWA